MHLCIANNVATLAALDNTLALTGLPLLRRLTEVSTGDKFSCQSMIKSSEDNGRD